MHRELIVLFILLVPSLAAVAREEPRLEAFSGYSWVTTSLLQDTGFVASREGFSGWNSSLTWNTSHNLGFVVEISGFLGSPTSGRTRYYSFLGGPKITHHNRADKVEVFVHQLFGESHATLTSGSSRFASTGFSMAAGFGMDFVIRKHMALRPVQVDYMISQLTVHSQNQFRVSTGVLLRWSFAERGISCPKCPADNSSPPVKSQKSGKSQEN